MEDVDSKSLTPIVKSEAPVGKLKKFKWSARKAKACKLLAEDKLTDVAIAELVGVSVVSLWQWKRWPEFSGRVDKQRAAIADAVLSRGIASVKRRVQAQDDRWRRMQSVIDARAEEHKDVKGGESGLLVKRLRSIGSGDSQQVVEEYEVDTGLLAELRAHEKQAAQELGQWIGDKAKGGLNVQGDLTVNHMDVRLTELLALAAERKRLSELPIMGAVDGNRLGDGAPPEKHV